MTLTHTAPNLLDEELAIARVRSIITGINRPRGRGVPRGAALSLLIAMVASAGFVAGRLSVAPSPRVIAAAPPRLLVVHRTPVAARTVAATEPAAPPAPRPEPGGAPTPLAVPASAPARTHHPQANYVVLPPQAPRHEPAIRPAPTAVASTRTEAVDGGNGAVAVHLTGEALQVALAKDAALTRQLNKAELRRTQTAEREH